jgi:phenylpyruvate tautomerase PptA (4-oxalocrotonate tautomerase family)
MVEVLSVPARDQFQVSSEHTRDDLIYDPTYLDIPRGDGILIIQITLNDGRTVEMKKAFYKALAERLNKELGVRKEDVFVNLVEVKKENWSFGSGVAQYAE